MMHVILDADCSNISSIKMVPPDRFELPTPVASTQCSTYILSYGGIKLFVTDKNAGVYPCDADHCILRQIPQYRPSVTNSGARGKS